MPTNPEAEEADDVCSRCEREYSFDAERGDTINICLDSIVHNVFTTCPYCGMTATIFVDGYWAVFCIVERQLEIMFVPETPEAVKRRYEEVRTRVTVERSVVAELERMFDQ